MTIAAGTQVGSYKILWPLGAGGVGEGELAQTDTMKPTKRKSKTSLARTDAANEVCQTIAAQ
jgi:hypothetical protein